jgi:hypothetical protein
MLVIGSTVALLFFSFLPNTAQKYTVAAEELRALEKLELSNYADFVEVAVDSASKGWGYDKAVAEAVGEADFSLPEETPFRGSAFLYYSKPTPIDTEAKLEELYKFLRSDHPIEVLRPDVESFKRQLVEWLRENAGEDPARLNRLKASNRHYITNLKVDSDTFDRRLGTVRIRGKLGRETGGGLDLSLGPIPARMVMLPDADLHTWIMSRPTYSQLVEKVEGQPVYLPHLSAIWSDISFMDIKEALAALKQLIASNLRSLSLFGFTIPADMVLGVGPPLIMVLLLFFLAHLKHLRFLLQSDPQPGLSYPWIALFPHVLSKVITHGSIVGLTTLSLTLLVANSWYFTAVTSWTGLLFSLGSILSAGLISREITLLQPTQ